MRIPRIYYDGQLVTGTTIDLPRPTAQHLRTVLRLRVNAELVIFNGHGGQYAAHMATCTQSSMRVTLGQKTPCHSESPLKVHLGQVISRGHKMDDTLQKAVELGVHEITPLFSTRCGVKLNHERQQKRHRHWQQIAIHAAEQSGREILPRVYPPLDIRQWLDGLAESEHTESASYRMVLNPTGMPWGEHLKLGARRPTPTHLTLLVGSEGGLTAEEIQTAEQQQFQSVALGGRILRTETAALVMMSVCQGVWGDF